MPRRVHVAHVGGTIGMRPTGGGGALEPGGLRAAIEELLVELGSELPEVELEEFSPLIDSANATPETWRTIARALYERRESFDGFVVLHGTDTMAYTASALSFMLPDFGKPVVVTGAQVPWGRARTDARQNLITALQIAGELDVPEVSLLFGRRLLRGNRATKVDATGLDAFESPNFPALAAIGTDISLRREVIRKPGPQPLLRADGSADVAAVRLFPGLRAETLSNLCCSPLRGLVLEAYGSGNGPAEDAEFLSAIDRASGNGVVVVVVTQCLRGSVQPSTYVTGSALAAAGAVPGYDMTTEAALTKLAVLLGDGMEPHRVRELMLTDLAGEITVARDDLAR